MDGLRNGVFAMALWTVGAWVGPVFAGEANDSPGTDAEITIQRSVSPESYVDVARIWKVWPVPVCWEADTASFPQEKQWIEQVIRKVMEDKSAIEFSGYEKKNNRWPQCNKNSLGIRIQAVNTRPRSDVGQQWSPDPYDAHRVEKPTLIRLNFELGGSYASYCEPRKRLCVEVIAVHEFMHAIGFLHEHIRKDAPTDCKEKFKHDVDDTGIEPVGFSVTYDEESMLNYCTSIYREPVQLSPDDIAAVNHFYRYQ